MMKHTGTYLLLTALCAAFAGCSKQQVADLPESEITYTIAPKVKSDDSFDKKWTFKSYAFYLANQSDGSLTAWAADRTSSTLYIDGSVISNPQGTDASAENVWRCNTRKYWWPKQGALTFLAWTSLKEDSSAGTVETSYIADGVTVTSAEGVKLTGYCTSANPKIDFLVADIKEDQTANTAATYNVDGVPTLFHHKLSKFCITAQTQDAAGEPYDYTQYSTCTVKFYINSITLKGVNDKGTYVQLPTEAWGSLTQTSSDGYSYFTSGATTSGEEITSTLKSVLADATPLYAIPQTFTDDAELVISYTVVTSTSPSMTITDTLSKTIKLSSLFPAFEKGKKYTLKLGFTSEEILIDPAVADWPVETGADFYVGE